MKPKATTKSRATAKSIASIKAKAIITKTNAATKTKATTKTKTTAKTKAVIYDSDGEVDDAMEEEMVSPGGEEPLYTPMESFNISRKRKLSVGHFRNGDAFIDIRESYPCKTSKRFRRGRGICLTLTQWRKILGLVPAIEESIKQVASKDNT